LAEEAPAAAAKAAEEAKAKAPPGSPWKFTNAGATGRFGPTQVQVNTAYAGTTLEDKITITTQGIQEWTVPATGIYRIDVFGAQGGNQANNYLGGKGSTMKGQFVLNSGDVLKILVGQKGENHSGDGGGSGGGGSFVQLSSGTFIIVAGGGGGAAKWSSTFVNGKNAVITTSGTNGDSGPGIDQGYSGGSSGSGGSGSEGQSGGGGILSNGGGDLGGNSFSLGGLGGTGERSGGFGGGSGSSSDRAPGAGGGYSGGGASKGGDYWGAGGGGGSYNGGTNQSNSSGVNTGHGNVVITFLQEPSVFIANVQVRQEGFEVIITYDMAGELQGKEGIMVGYSTNGGRIYKPISNAGGDLGKYVLAGTGREISLLTNDTFAGKNASFEVFVSSSPSSPPGSPWNFTNAGATGRFGPTQAQVNTAYAGSSLEGEVTIFTQGIQEWTVPTTGTYTIEASGAQGGTQPEYKYGGRGARMKGDFLLDGGDTLQIAVGQSGLSASSSDGDGGGGGGTFVAQGTSISSASPLIIAGGGGGDGSDSKGGDATSKWNALSNSNTGNGGNNSGGGGFNSSASSYGGRGFIQGAVGGDGWYDGGFGGGGGSQDETASGGGGYTGGYASDNSSTGGAGSYNSGTNKSNSSGVNTGYGKVVITYVSEASAVSVAVSSGVSRTIIINGVEDVAGERNPELFLPRDEFETSAEYSQRVAHKEALIKDLRAQLLAEQKVRKKKRARLAAERAAEEEHQLQIKIALSSVPVEFTPSGLGRYDADEGTFPLTVNGQTYTVAIPRSEARDFKANYTTAKVEGYKQLQRDLKTYDYFDLVVIHPITGSRIPLAVEEVVIPIDYVVLVEKHDGFYTRDGNEPYSGPVFSLFENGNKKMNGTFKEGLMMGEWVFYWPEENQILAKGQYVNGDGKGSDPEYKISWIPKNGREGVWEYYYQNGNQWFEKTYEDGIPMGEYLEWWYNGEKKEEGVFKGVDSSNWGFPVKVGKWTYWYETGQKSYEKTY